MASLTSHRFTIGDYVFLRGDNAAWFVSGLRLRCGYDVFLWEYFISRNAYTPLEQGGPVKLAWKTDYDTKEVREDQLLSAEEYEKIRRDELLAQRKGLEDELKSLNMLLGTDAR